MCAHDLSQEGRGLFIDIKDRDGNPLYKIAYDDLGSRQDPCPIVCVHGLTNTRHDFDFVMEALVGAGRRVINLEMVGRGDSDRAPDPNLYSVPQYASDCAQVIRQLGLKAVDWIGTSMGGLIAFHAIPDQHVPVRNLVLVDIGPEVPFEYADLAARFVEDGWTYGTYDSCIESRLAGTSDVGPMTKEQRLYKAEFEYHLEDGQYVQTFDTAIAVNLWKDYKAGIKTDEWKRFEQIKCPILVFHGESSPVLLPETISKMVEIFPSIKIINVSGIGHYPALADEQQIQEVQNFVGSSPLFPNRSVSPLRSQTDPST